jgi:Fic family protein
LSKIEEIWENWHQLAMQKILDFEKFNHYAIVHHSTTIEGSTLTDTEVQLLLDEGITPKGKPLQHSLMSIDHFKALKFIVECANKRKPITPELICSINAMVLKQTGGIYNTPFGTVDASNGEYRKGNVRAGNSYFVNYDKVPLLVEQLCQKLMELLSLGLNKSEALNLSFDAHFDLVSIHPFYDGNGRTSRLLMNYIQQYCGLPLGIVFKEDKVAYFEALVQSREMEDITIFRNFMLEQYEVFLEKEMHTYLNQRGKTGNIFSIVF